MKSNLNFLFAVLVVVGIVSLALVSRGCSTPRVPEFIDPLLTFDEAMVRSVESGKPAFVLVSADWCGSPAVYSGVCRPDMCGRMRVGSCSAAFWSSRGF